MNYRFVKSWVFKSSQQHYVQTNCNEVVVLQQGEHSSVNNSRPAGEEDRYKKKERDRDIGENEEKEKGSEGAVLRHFLCDGHRNRLIGLSMFQNLLWCMGWPG